MVACIKEVPTRELGSQPYLVRNDGDILFICGWISEWRFTKTTSTSIVSIAILYANITTDHIMIFIMCYVYTAITSSEFRQEGLGRRGHASALQVYGVEGVAVSSFDWIRSLPYTERPTVHVCIHFVRNQAIYGTFLNNFASAVSEKSTISPVRCSSNRSTTVLLRAIWSY